ncbi:MAG: retropepsin-like domain-containing protein [Eudoraea sp.]|nr:retropepsin-like domain-containing protein [Eudoraea sp.]
MKNSKPLIYGLFLCLIFSCSISKNQKKGNVIPENFEYETEFAIAKSVIILPFEINGVTKNFLFDTGADYNVIQRDSFLGRTRKYDGASNRKAKLGSEIVESMKFGDVEFKNTYAVNGDLIGLKEQIPNFGGLVGQPIIGKANWLIDYPNKTLQISSKNLSDNTFRTIKIKREHGAPYTLISINGIEHKVIIDFGSSSEFNLPEDSKLAKQLLQQHHFNDNERDRYTLGGLQTIKEKVGIVPLIKLGEMEFKNVNTTVNVSRQPRIGIGFFKDCMIYIDNIDDNYKIRK